MVKAARQTISWEYSQLCDIASIALGDVKYFDAVKASFDIGKKPKFLESHSSYGGPVVKAESQDAMWMFMEAISARKGRN